MDKETPSWSRGVRFVAAGTELAASVVAGVIAGYYLDRYCGSAPWLTLLFTIAGLFGGLTRLFWTLRALEQEEKQQRGS
jgi:ATP synthase protein I